MPSATQGRSIVAGVALLAACETSTSNDPPPPRADRPASQAIAVECREADAIDDEQRKAIEAVARSAHRTLVRSDYDALWAMLHPQAKRGQKKGPVFAALQSMRARLGDDPVDPEIEWAYFVDVEGGANDLARVQCADADAASSLELLTNAGSEDLAVVSMWIAGDPYAYTTTVTLRQRAGSWRVVGIHVSPSAFRSKTALDFFRAARTFDEEGSPVAAYLSLGAARTLSGRGSSVTTGLRRKIDENLTAIENSEAFRAQLGEWSVGDQTYVVHGFGLASTQSDLSAVVQYVTPGGLVRETLETEADAMIEHVRTRYPRLDGMFDAVVFEAYREVPTREDAKYDAYRIARYLDPDRSNDEPPSVASPPAG